MVYIMGLVGGFPGTWLDDSPTNCWEYLGIIIPINEVILFRGVAEPPTRGFPDEHWEFSRLSLTRMEISLWWSVKHGGFHWFNHHRWGICVVKPVLAVWDDPSVFLNSLGHHDIMTTLQKWCMRGISISKGLFYHLLWDEFSHWFSDSCNQEKLHQHGIAPRSCLRVSNSMVFTPLDRFCRGLNPKLQVVVWSMSL